MGDIRAATGSTTPGVQRGLTPEQEQQMEQLGTYLDALEEKDPEEYKRVMTEMAAKMGAAKSALNGSGGTESEHADSSVGGLASLAAAMAAGNAGGESVRLPGGNGRVLGNDGVTKSSSAIKAITVTPSPGFVIKTKSGTGESATKVFINVVTSDSIKSMSMRKQLDPNTGEEQEGVHVPCSLNPPRPGKDKSGVPCSVYDVMMNPSVLADMEADPSGGFKQWLSDICVENVERKFRLVGGGLALDRKYKYPKLRYKAGEGEDGGVVPSHRIKAPSEQTPTISEVGGKGGASKGNGKGKGIVKNKKNKNKKGKCIGDEPLSALVYELSYAYGDEGDSIMRPDRGSADPFCFGSCCPAAEGAGEGRESRVDGAVLPSEPFGVPELDTNMAPYSMTLTTVLENFASRPAKAPVTASETVGGIQRELGISISISAWILTIDASIHGHSKLELFLPFPVVTDKGLVKQRASDSGPAVSVSFDPVTRMLNITMPVDLESAVLLNEAGPGAGIIEGTVWTDLSAQQRLQVAAQGLREGAMPDIGSRPWLLAQALSAGNGDDDSKVDIDDSKKDLAQVVAIAERETAAKERVRRARLRAIHGDSGEESDSDGEVLPEDRFHRADIMSRHMLDEKRKSRREARKQQV